MSMDDPKTFGRARLSFATEAEVENFVAMLGKFERGEVSPDEWRGFRLVHGTYGQRQGGDLSMLRLKIPQGVLTGAQLPPIAHVARTWPRGFWHITTRQNIHVHFLKLHDLALAIRPLAD